MRLNQTLVLIIWCCAAFSGVANADIHQWEYIDPERPYEGKRQTMSLVPNGLGLHPMPGLAASNKDLTRAYLFESDLRDAVFQGSTLANAYLRSSNLTRASFENASLSGADISEAILLDTNLANADVRGADFRATTESGFTADQLYSTASYQAGDLTGIVLRRNDLSGWNFAGQTLVEAHLGGHIYEVGSNLANASFRNANLTGASIYWSNLTGADFTGANLSDADLTDANMLGVNLQDALVSGADFETTEYVDGITLEQIYSTASYRHGDLRGIGLSWNDLSHANLAGKDLTGSRFYGSQLVNVNFNDSDLTGADLGSTTLTEATFAGAIIRQADLSHSGLTAEQIYSTASHQAGDLAQIVLRGNDLSDWDLSGQDLTGADFGDHSQTTLFHGANLEDAKIDGADLTHTTANGFSATQLYSTASYRAGNLTHTDFSWNDDFVGWDFSGQNLSESRFLGSVLRDSSFRSADLRGVRFTSAVLTDADFTDANVAGVDLDASGITAQQLYSTATFRSGNLSGLNLGRNDLQGWNFSRKVLADARFYNSNLSEADLSDANLMHASFGSAQLHGTSFSGANLVGVYFVGSEDSIETDLTGADARSAILLNCWSLPVAVPPSGCRNWLVNAVKRNFIDPDGHVEGLNIAEQETMRLWDFDPMLPRRNSDAPVGDIPLVVEDEMTIDADGTLRAVFEDDHWGSTITFEPGVIVELAGTLELLIDPGEETTIESLIGTTYQLFDWTGVSPVGEFDTFNFQPDTAWDTSGLYTTGEVTLRGVPEPSGLLLLGFGAAAFLFRPTSKW